MQAAGAAQQLAESKLAANLLSASCCSATAAKVQECKPLFLECICPLPHPHPHPIPHPHPYPYPPHPFCQSDPKVCMQAAGAAQQLAQTKLAATASKLKEIEHDLKVSCCLPVQYGHMLKVVCTDDSKQACSWQQHSAMCFISAVTCEAHSGSPSRNGMLSEQEFGLCRGKTCL